MIEITGEYTFQFTRLSICIHNLFTEFYKGELDEQRNTTETPI